MSYGNHIGYRSHVGLAVRMTFTEVKKFKRIYTCGHCGGRAGIERRSVGRPWCLGRVTEHGNIEIELRRDHHKTK